MKDLIGMSFRINNELNIEADYTAGKVKKHKIIDINRFCDIVSKSSEVTECNTGILPAGCIAYRENPKTFKRFVVLELKERRMNLTYEKTLYRDFPLPRLIYGFWVDRYGKVTSVKVTVAENGKLTENTILYEYPFSNVSDYKMCTGSNQLPTVKSLAQLERMPYYIFSMPDNNDLYRKYNTKLDMEYRNLLEYLEDKDSDFYYSDVLVQNGETLSDFINRA